MHPHSPITLRPLEQADVPFLSEALYQAIYVPPGGAPPLRALLRQPELDAYISGFGQRPGDWGVLALAGPSPIGAAWARLMHGYGFVEEGVPEMSLSVLPGWRGQGVGTRLLAALMAALRPQVGAVSLSVSQDNPAVRLYARAGFIEVGRDAESLTMLCRWAADR